MTKDYQGSCHCGAVQYKAKADLENTLTCNCSMCGRSGTILTFVQDTDFDLKSGQESLTDYQFNQKNIHHLFCKICGIKSFGKGIGKDGKEMIAINVRCLEGVDIDTLKPQKMNGKDF